VTAGLMLTRLSRGAVAGVDPATLATGSRPTLECFPSPRLWKSRLQTRRVRHETDRDVTPVANIAEGRLSGLPIPKA